MSESSVLEAPDGRELVRIKPGSGITSVVFLPDCEHILTVGGDGDGVRVWDVITGRQVGDGIKGSERVRDIAASKDGKWIVGVGSEYAIVWDARTHKEAVRIRGWSKETICTVDVSPDSTTFVTGGEKETGDSFNSREGNSSSETKVHAFIWDISNGRKLVDLKLKQFSHSSGVGIRELIFSPQGDRIAVRTAVGCFSSGAVTGYGLLKMHQKYDSKAWISILDTRSGQLLITLPHEVDPWPRQVFAWSIDGQHVFASYTGSIKQLGISKRSLPSIWRIHQRHEFVECIALSNTGTVLVCPTTDFNLGQISLWDTSARTQLGPAIMIGYRGMGNLIRIVLSPDDRFLAICEDDNIVIHNLYDIVPESCRYLLADGDPQPLSKPSADFFVKRSKSGALEKLWDAALNDAELAIARDPSCIPAYECKHAALHGAARYDEAIETHKMIFAVIQESLDPTAHELLKHYIHPSKAAAMIRKHVQSALQRMPRMLIDSTSGHLHDKNAQASLFEMSIQYKELVSAMSTAIDHPRIEKAVATYFRYVMLSHNWNGIEPLFQSVENISIYDLKPSSTAGDPAAIEKLQKFGLLVRDLGFLWFWSDTCCIDKRDNVVTQESLVLMFTWYRGLVLTVVYLHGVPSPSNEGDLASSVWNTRGWTYQEYVAAETIQFYNEDWKPYLGLPTLDDNKRLINHKSLPAIQAEMEQVVRARLGDCVLELHPGRDYIREKLCLASMRQTTRIEDAAYSLFGILSTSIDVKYGEGEEALGRFLAQLLTSSADVSILAWTGESSSWNSCMPARITVFRELATSHLPAPLETVEHLNTSIPDLSLAMQLYDRLSNIGAPWFAASRMRLPCITFRLGPLRIVQRSGLYAYRAKTTALGTVEFITKDDLSHIPVGSLYLSHPWISYILDREMIDDTLYEEELGLPSPFSDEDLGHDSSDEDKKAPPPTVSAPLPSSTMVRIPRVSPLDKQTRALRLLARLRQPFGALLFKVRTGRVGVEFQRVASDCLIRVRVQENLDLNHLMASVRVLDVL